MDTSFLYFLALLATLVFFLTRNPNQTKKKIPPPSPPALPVIGHLHLLKEPFHRTLESLSRRYGPIFHLRLGRCRFLIVSSPQAAEQCLAQNDVAFANRPPFAPGELLAYNYTMVAWAMYGDLWRNLRRVITLEALSSHRLQQSSRIRVEEVRFVAREALLGSGSGKVDLNKAFFLLTRNMIMRMVAGKRWASSGASEDLFVPSKFMTVCDFFPVLRWVGYGGLEKKMRTVWLNRDRFMQGLLDEARNGKEGEEKTTSSLVEELLTLQKKEPEYYTDNILKGMLLAVLSAGTDTSARTMEWVMSLLLNHPTTFNKTRSEIDDHVGTSRLVDDSDLSNLTFLRCVINETLRLFPVAPLLVPHCSSTDTTISGYHVPKGTTLLVNAWALHRDPSVWEDPLAFRPERFEAGPGDSGGPGFRFVPFGMGRRACPGMNLAMRTMMLAVATWIQCFDWDNAEGGVVDMEELGGGITMSKSQHLQAVCKPRACMVNVLSQL
uniref:Cytochrome P450 81AG1 n=1 Tax=Reynoutria sachalinensis TaxID=76036 RepID=A0A140JTI1_9CARY|nr:cytochrome P450 81AG1 [Fallopia sachalinensis]